MVTERKSSAWKLRWLAVGALAALCFMAANAAAAGQTATSTADKVVVHGRIYTVNEKQPWAEALAIRGETIVAVGSDKEIDAYRGSSTLVIDAAGRLVLPGFEDCHIHFMDGSLGLDQVDLNEKFYADMRDKLMPGKALWLTETAEAGCGGDQ